MYSCGNTLTFVQSDGKHIHSCVSEGKGVGSLTVCQKARLLAYSETTLEPKIFVVGYPSCGVQIALEGMQAIIIIVVITLFVYRRCSARSWMFGLLRRWKKASQLIQLSRF